MRDPHHATYRPQRRESKMRFNTDRDSSVSGLIVKASGIAAGGRRCRDSSQIGQIEESPFARPPPKLCSEALFSPRELVLSRGVLVPTTREPPVPEQNGVAKGKHTLSRAMFIKGLQVDKC